MTAFELLGQHVQIGVADTKRLQLFHRRQHVVAAGARPAVTLARIVQLLCEAQSPGILAMAAVDDIAKRMHAFLRVVVEPDPAPGLAIDPSDLFAGAQVFDCL